MSTSSNNDVYTGVYEDQNETLSVRLEMDNNVAKIANEFGYSWNMCYSVKRVGETAKVIVSVEYLGRYSFDDKVTLEVNVESSTKQVRNSFEIEKKSGHQVFQTSVLKRFRKASVMENQIKVSLHLHIEQRKYRSYSNFSIGSFHSQERPHDAVLLVGSEKFYVQKTVLATWSKYFDKLFFDDSAADDRLDYPVAEFSPAEILDLLRYIHPDPSLSLTDDNLFYMIIMAKRFEMPFLETKCGTFLMDFEKCPAVTLMDRLQISDQMNHSSLQVACLRKIHAMNAVDYKQFFAENSERLKKLSNNTIRNLL